MKYMQWTTTLFLFFIISCKGQSSKIANTKTNSKQINYKIDSNYQTIHIYTALCDNKYQGIVPVPAKIGNGQDPNNNLYWGCAFGIKTYFKNSKEWQLISTQKLDSNILERIIFKHKTKKYHLIADAYNGKNIKNCITDFANNSAGILQDTMQINNKIYGNSKLVCYIGHNGLMDFTLTENFKNTDAQTRNTIILACYGKNYFAPLLANAKISPLVWSTGFMSPEAYTVHDAINAYIANADADAICNKAAVAYSKYQKCSYKAARRLLVN